MSISERIEFFFEISALGDIDNNRLLPEGNQFFTSFEQWEVELNKEMEWIQENSTMVRLNLAPLREKWPTCCNILESLLEQL
jgi:hypothetical protein